MKVRLLVFLMALGLLIEPATPQTMIHNDVQSVLRAVADAMGTDNVETLRITGAPNSTIRALGQSYTTRAVGPNVDYPTLARLSLGYDTTLWEAKELIKRHVSAIRRKIEPDPASPRYILNVRGVGYRLAASDPGHFANAVPD